MSVSIYRCSEFIVLLGALVVAGALGYLTTAARGTASGVAPVLVGGWVVFVWGVHRLGRGD
jgi:hypothetical protein